jgi:leukotriene A-4 hydrolase/aminopeptidase
MRNFVSRLIHLSFVIIFSASLFSTACSTREQPQQGQPMKTETTEKDAHSFANAADVVVKHLGLDVAVDFDRKQITGRAMLEIDNKTGARELHLDTRDLNIERVTLEPGGADARFRLGEEVEYLGKPLVIEILPETKAVAVHYSTSPAAAALQWLAPEQTAGKQKPFLFTQSQSILARSWVPCQDSPGVRMTYRARVKTRPDLLAVMSAKNTTQKSPEGVYEFDMPQAVPSYLLALAVGDIDFRSLGSRSGVYAEPSVVERAAYEFADLEKMMVAAEELYGPYRWERYDVIVLPPSFPFGGMENPRLTFATPTILAGDRSLVSLIAHELAHSWSGNLVTNATWNDFWLNEGFTVYFERRVMEELAGRDYSEMLAQLAYQDMLATIDEFGKDSPMTRLHVDLTGQDPDAGMNDIAYEKGYFFLRLIEENVGREKFDAFLRKYFDTFAFQTMTTDRFLAYMRENLIAGDKALEERLKIDQWINGAGLPDNSPRPQSKQFEQVEAQVKAWAEGTSAQSLQTSGWTSHHWQHFLRKLPAQMAQQQMAELDSTFHFTQSGNSEILNEWFLRAIANNYSAAYPALENFLTSVGRRKFLKPLYTEMARSPEGRQMARAIYAKARPGYHSVSYTTIDEILKWDESVRRQ